MANLDRTNPASGEASTQADEPAPRRVDDLEATEIDPVSDRLGSAPTVAVPPGPEVRDGRLPPVPGYELLRELGRGGMGVVYLARQSRLNRLCALKMLLGGHYASTDAVRRFKAEAEAVARLQHPNVVQIFSVGDVDGQPYVELEYMSGGSLDRVLDGTPWPVLRAVELVETLGRAVVEAHARGIVHRDLKPGNILLTDGGVPKVGDFGLAKAVGSEGNQTATESILGSPCYMAPEQAGGSSKAVGPAADVYALGAILYELLTGRPPFKGATVLETLEQVRSVEPVAPGRLVYGLPRDVETITLKCLQKDPARRYGSTSELVDDLERYREGRPIAARPVRTWERVWKYARRRPELALLFAAVHLLLAALLGLGIWSYVEVNGALSASRRQEAVTRGALARAVGEEKRAQAARKESEAARAQAQAEAYHATLSETRALRLARSGGWKSQALANLTRLADQALTPADRAALRSEAVDALGALDLRTEAILRGTPAARLWRTAISGDGNSLIVLDEAAQTVRILDMSTRRVRGEHVLGPSPGAVTLLRGGPLLAYGTPDGPIAFASIDGEGPVPPSMPGEGQPHALAASADGRRLAVARSTGDPWTIDLVTVYDLATREVVREIRAPRDPHSFKVPLALSPDGRLLASVGPGHEVQVHEVDATGPPAVLGRHLASVSALAFSPDGASLASSSNSGDLTIRVWDVAAGRERLSLHGHTERIWDVAFSPDGQTIASTGDDMTVRLWEARNGRERLVARVDVVGSCLSLAFHPDGRMLAVCGVYMAIERLSGREALQRLEAHQDAVVGLTFTPDSTRLLSRSHDQTLRLWDLATRAPVRQWSMPPNRYASAAAIEPGGGRLCVAISGPEEARPEIQILEPGSETRPLSAFPLDRPADALAVDPGAGLVVAGTRGGSVLAWRLDTGQPAFHDRVASPVSGLQFEAGGGRLLVATHGGQLVELDRTGAVVRESHLALDIISLAVSGDAVWVAARNGQVRRLSRSDPERPPLSRAIAAGWMEGLAVSPDARLLAVGAGDGRVRLLDAGTLEEILTIGTEAQNINVLAFSPDGRFLAIGSSAEAIELWELPGLRNELRRLGLDWGASASGGTGAGGPSELATAGPPAVSPPSVAVGAAGQAPVRLGAEATDQRFPRDPFAAPSPLAPPAPAPRGGIGVAFEVGDSGELVITGLLPGGPAQADGRLKPGDALLGVEQTLAFAGRTEAELGRLLQGPAGTTVRLVVRPAGTDRRDVVELTRRPLASTPGFLEEVRLGQAIKKEPGNAGLWLSRGHLRARRQDWAGALADLRKGIELDPDNHLNWYYTAGLFLQVGDLEGYRRHGLAMLERFASAPEANVQERTAKACSLLPGQLDPQGRPVRLGARAVAQGGPYIGWFHVAYALAAYRAGDLDRAATESAAAVASGLGDYGGASSRLISALVLSRQGQAAAARARLDEAREILRTTTPAPDAPDIGPGWPDWVMTRLILKEAEEMIEGN